MEEKISFQSDGLKIAGLDRHSRRLQSPASAGRHLSCCMASAATKTAMARPSSPKQFTQWGYVTLRIDFRGCGESEGEHGRIICLDQVADTRNALSYLGRAPGSRSATNRPGRQQLRRGGRGFHRRRRQSRGRGDLLRRLGRRRAQVPRPASDAGRLGRNSPTCSKKANAIASAPANRSWCRATTSCRSRRNCAIA